ncbi:MAG: thioredoxin family protein [Holophagaceae bacterium]
MRLPSLLLALSLPLAAQSALVWEHDLANAQKRAKKEGKLLFVDVWAEWCPPCQYLKANVFPSPEAQKALQAYVPVSLMTETRDRREQADAAAVARRYRVEAYPTLLIMDADGKEKKRQVGALSTGRDLATWLARK